LLALCLLTAVLLITGGVLVYRTQPAPTDPKEQFVHVGQQAVRESIEEDLKTVFCDLTETSVEDLPGDRHRVSGWVDLFTADGHSDRQNFSVVVYQNTAGEWLSEKIVVVPQI
jgi:hypothetical protein